MASKDHYDGNRNSLLEIIRRKSGIKDFAETGDPETRRAYVRNQDLWKLYRRLCSFKRKEPGYFMEGRQIVEKGELPV